MNESIPAILLLEDGTFFKGLSVGHQGTSHGEIAFTTGMTGYQETFTDPSYFGQIICMTSVHIGNYGYHENESESVRIHAPGIVVKKFSNVFSRVAATESLQDALVRNECVGISDIDTRALVRHIRNKGAMNAIISSEELNPEVLQLKFASIPSMKGLELASKVSTSNAIDYPVENAQFKVSLMDFGVKQNIVRCLNERGCSVKVFPYNASMEEILSFNPDGIMLSNGPGDPEPLTDQIQVIKALVGTNIPMFGICLGHQLLGLSQGLTTEKMFNGHRGYNHPIKNLLTGKGEITSQNHGFVLSDDSLQNNEQVEVTHRHLNDNTIAGIKIANKPVFSVQYHPESSGGPNDSRYLFDQFIENMSKHTNR